MTRTISIAAATIACLASFLPHSAPAGDDAPSQPVTLANVEAPAPNSPNEPIAAQYSAEKAKHFLDSASLTWQAKRDCMTCHTNYLYLLSRPALGADDEAHRTVRKYAEDLVNVRWPDKGPRWDAEVVMSALVLAYNDRTTSSALSPTTRTALDRMWTIQKPTGGFEWIKCGWPPYENDDEFGAPMAALAVSVAPEDYARSPAAAAGIASIKKYLAATPMPSLHHRAILLWADTYLPGWLNEADQKKCLDELLALQLEDGGWSSATLGDWQRADGSPQQTTTSDGYATGLVIYLARRAGIAADNPQLTKGIGWLKTHQRESGRWFTRSLHKDSTHFLSHAGSSMAILALDSCDALK